MVETFITKRPEFKVKLRPPDTIGPSYPSGGFNRQIPSAV